MNVHRQRWMCLLLPLHKQNFFLIRAVVVIDLLVVFEVRRRHCSVLHSCNSWSLSLAIIILGGYFSFRGTGDGDTVDGHPPPPTTHREWIGNHTPSTNEKKLSVINVLSCCQLYKIVVLNFEPACKCNRIFRSSFSPIFHGFFVGGGFDLFF